MSDRQVESVAHALTVAVMMRSNQTPAHVLLGVSRSASLTEIKSAYRAKARQLHPDLLVEPTEAELDEARRMFTDLTIAYDALCEQANEPTVTVPDFVPAAWTTDVASGNDFAPTSFATFAGSAQTVINPSYRF